MRLFQLDVIRANHPVPALAPRADADSKLGGCSLNRPRPLRYSPTQAGEAVGDQVPVPNPKTAVDATIDHCIRKTTGDDAMGILDDFGHTVGKAVKGIADAVGGVIKTVAGDLENAVKIAENVFSGYIQGVGQVLLVEGKIIVAAYQTLEMLYAELVQDAIGARPLRPEEIAKAQEVFKGSVPLDRVLICSLTGFGGSRFTLPGP